MSPIEQHYIDGKYNQPDVVLRIALARLNPIERWSEGMSGRSRFYGRQKWNASQYAPLILPSGSLKRPAEIDIKVETALAGSLARTLNCLWQPETDFPFLIVGTGRFLGPRDGDTGKCGHSHGVRKSFGAIIIRQANPAPRPRGPVIIDRSTRSGLFGVNVSKPSHLRSFAKASPLLLLPAPGGQPTAYKVRPSDHHPTRKSPRAVPPSLPHWRRG